MHARLRSIDVLRGLAASAVVLRHCDKSFLLGSIGVDLFFVISGFVMANVAQGRTAGEFLAGRAWRIFPVYWIALTLCLLLRWYEGEAISVRDATISALLIPNWFGFYKIYLGIAWTLIYELLFYTAVAVALRLKNWHLPMIFFIGAMAARPWVEHPLISIVGSPIMIEFLFGLFIATLPRDRTAGLALLIIATAFLILFPNLWLEDFRIAISYQPAMMRALLWGIPAAMLVYGALCFEQSFKGKVVDGLLLLGTASYSIYLLHNLVVPFFRGHWYIGFALSIGTGVAMWWLVERRLMAIRPGELMRSLTLRRASPQLGA